MVWLWYACGYSMDECCADGKEVGMMWLWHERVLRWRWCAGGYGNMLWLWLWLWYEQVLGVFHCLRSFLFSSSYEQVLR